MRNQLNIFLTALMFYTRIPVKRDIGYSSENLNKATRYFPLIGLIVGGISALVFWGASFVLPSLLSVILATAATIYVTGSFHEDGFADFCDGFGGGLTPEKIITIMKDSRIGTSGAVGLLLLLSTKIFTISEIEIEKIPLVIVAAHGLSRVMPVLVIFTSNYVRDDMTSKIKPIGKKGSNADLVTAITLGAGLLFFFPWIFSISVIALLLLITFLFRKYITKKIGGYTGDCLGALQQISEVAFYLLFLILEGKI
ncbi:MAG: adenosylcobinamide-GDP ribazoletransferase [Prolixibacteraceae bacterium]|jgi:adenosylcobinamide-GDP ribazoletransferase|nr:adenosylcobinamide-GDP ribazoletransferase [Prolixibacteraceae bacterium]